MPREATVFIDDSGTKEIEDVRTPLFAYVGVATTAWRAQRIGQFMLDLKMEYFGANPEIKSRWLRRPELRMEHYLVPYGITEARLNSFVETLYDYLASSRIRCLGAVIDKMRLQQHYKRFIFSPSSICYEFLMQRITNMAHEFNVDKVGIVIDDMSGANQRGSQWKKLLIRQHTNLLQGASPFYKNWASQSGMDYSCLAKEPDFRDSRQEQMLQVADLCAYNVFAQARRNWGDFDNPPFYAYYGRLRPIMHCARRSRSITRFGLVCYPQNCPRGPAR